PGNIWLESVARSPSSGAKTSDSTATDHGPQTTDFRVKILDCALARRAGDPTNLTQTGLVLGTPAYMAPEQAEGGAVDARSDLFSLGCVLYEVGTGASPFAGANTMAVLMAVAMKDPLPPTRINPDLPDPLSDLVMRLLA